MGSFRLTSCAESDLAKIADHTIGTFGIEQARRYRDALETCFQTIADNPKLASTLIKTDPVMLKIIDPPDAQIYMRMG